MDLHIGLIAKCERGAAVCSWMIGTFALWDCYDLSGALLGRELTVSKRGRWSGKWSA